MESISSKVTHRVQTVQMRSFFWSVFSCIRTDYGDLRSKSPYSVQKQENADQKKLFGHFSLSDQVYQSTAICLFTKT